MVRARGWRVCLVLLFLGAAGGGCARVSLEAFLSAGRERGRSLQVQKALVAETALSRKYTLRLANGQGRELDYFLREPRQVRGPMPAVFILAGFETGRESLDFIDERDDVLLLSMNYPYRGPLALQGFGLLRALPTLRRMAFETLEGSLLALSYFSQRADVDQERIILLGVSFGSIFITALGAYDVRPDAVVLIYGGGNLPLVARHYLRNKPWWLPSWIIGLLVRAFFGEIEPLLHVEKIAPRYFLMINSEKDEMFPISSALALFERAGDPKKLVWYETGHMDLFDRELIRALTKEVVTELRAAGYLPRREGHSRLE
ncbi:MAG: alpha/beta hydrolase [Candidatus Methylomirabilales bacterium]